MYVHSAVNGVAYKRRTSFILNSIYSALQYNGRCLLRVTWLYYVYVFIYIKWTSLYSNIDVLKYFDDFPGY